ncbi:MAG TPA: NAD-dependent epimerase/dehydratase family protein [Candidatus Acidoferrales bacterium]|nr:NAD-dependent epimerase/dehydratase family protein [Candidatus Acidoferrales bacterium]
MGNIGIIGATGAVGQAIAKELHAQGRGYVAVGRDQARLEALFGGDPLATCRSWDTESAATLEPVLEGVESVIYLIGVEYWKFDLHPILMRRALDGARAAGVKRLLLIGTVYPYGRPQTPRVAESHPRDPHTFKGRMRKEQEDLVLAAHVPGVFETVELRLPDLYGPGMERSLLTSAFVNAPLGKASQVLGPIDKPHEYAFIPDCAAVALRVLDEPRTYGRFWNYGGPGAITTRAFVDEIYAQCGKKPRYQVATKPLLRLLGLFDPIMRELVEMNYLIVEPVILDDSALEGVIGDLRKTPYKEGIARTLAG